MQKWPLIWKPARKKRGAKRHLSPGPWAISPAQRACHTGTPCPSVSSRPRCTRGAPAPPPAPSFPRSTRAASASAPPPRFFLVPKLYSCHYPQVRRHMKRKSPSSRNKWAFLTGTPISAIKSDHCLGRQSRSASLRCSTDARANAVIPSRWLFRYTMIHHTILVGNDKTGTWK